jgi:hypothetical protein
VELVTIMGFEGRLAEIDYLDCVRGGFNIYQIRCGSDEILRDVRSWWLLVSPRDWSCLGGHQACA